MKLDPLINTLLTAARRQTPSAHVPYAFEQRVMARLREIRPGERLAVWTAGLWRAALSSLAVAAVLVGADVVAPDHELDALAVDQLEAAMVASADSVSEFGQLVKAGKLILAALVIFLAGMAAGSAAAGLRWKARAKAEQDKRELVPSPMGYRLEFLRRAQRDLNLSADQQSRIEGHVRESQDRFRALWEPVAPQARTEFEALRERIRGELNPDQLARFDQLLQERSHRGDNRDRRPDGNTNNRPPSAHSKEADPRHSEGAKPGQK